MDIKKDGMFEFNEQYFRIKRTACFCLTDSTFLLINPYPIKPRLIISDKHLFKILFINQLSPPHIFNITRFRNNHNPIRLNTMFSENSCLLAYPDKYASYKNGICTDKRALTGF
ncbi:MAG TPA: hypothetical protein DCG19_06040 [Cryomorphaceae bacterium]|nr:hypothetical protein [Owenweeksia sp.]HAD96947.1 hypothetical protein [Cryomorphaceae bacterium]HCQ15975.1 hypothetical protein [Cryomorphaceae bacterium]